MKSKHSIFLFYFLASIIMTGCVSQSVDSKSDDVIEHSGDISEIQMVRYGRYTLVEVGADSGQNNLMEQIIDIKIPVTKSRSTTTVADAIRYVLRNSGYQFCKIETVHIFEKFTLPAAHYELGPMTLKDALSALAGTGWHLTVDYTNRTVCFISDEEKQQQNN